MQNHLQRALSVREAAKIIYATEEPTPGQIERVCRRLETGVLAGTLVQGRRPRWRTTADSVAQYMAIQAYRRHLPSPTPNGDRSRPPGTPSPSRAAMSSDNTQLGNVCREILKDYFQALIFRRRARRIEAWFRHAVIAGQLGLLGLLLAVSSMTFRQVFRVSPPEHAVIQRWIEQNVGDFQVTAWHPATPNPDGQGVSVRVQYRYFAAGGKAVHTDRRFVVEGNRVTAVDSD